MNINVQTAEKTFSLTELNFSDIKTIRDACKAHAKNGSASAKKMLEEIEKALENVAF